MSVCQPRVVCRCLHSIIAVSGYPEPLHYDGDCERIEFISNPLPQMSLGASQLKIHVAVGRL
ncbi:hypothetical protein JVT61DRAFT_2819 [Boletus reticuloceps]|uniref:Uncharacterized protein n=1 Tax=Boletus reticuloceps TaxID=495285 RepID=A0A8I3A8M7_9AGAM|nr:hypothetical protein JVT61DRAFT_2819 [Boletus reticuloceps]